MYFLRASTPPPPGLPMQNAIIRKVMENDRHFHPTGILQDVALVVIFMVSRRKSRKNSLQKFLSIKQQDMFD